MSKINVNVLAMNLLIAIALLIALFCGVKATVICDFDLNKLDICHAAINGKHPPKPNAKCCEVIKHANLPCLCTFKSFLPALGINPKKALALPRKCGLKTPSECRCKPE
uniref:Lipid-transfer protein DIR1 n=1 Tax=Cicer arietinum TaxID=3827 RepID=A0A1S3E792_CICAR|nr:putative lipid-transfer protein DIR1 [Cicer arietinum]